MKIAVAADASDIDTDVADQGARAPFFLIFGNDGRLHATLANPVAAGGQHAGPAAAQFLAGQGVGLVAAGDFGPRFLDALDEHNIGHVQAAGRITDVIARLLAHGGGR